MAQRLPTERIGLAAYWLATGEAVTVRQMAAKLEMSERGARMLLTKLSLALPLVDDEGVWRICGNDGARDHDSETGE